MNIRTAVLIAVVVLAPVQVAGAAEIKLRAGFYEVSYRLELPHLERYGIDRTAMVCIGDAKRPAALPVPVLSAKAVFAGCPVTDIRQDLTKFEYQVSCAGRGAARATAIYRLGPDQFGGRIAMVLGAKNMTMTEVQRGRWMGSCEVVENLRN